MKVCSTHRLDWYTLRLPSSYLYHSPSLSCLALHTLPFLNTLSAVNRIKNNTLLRGCQPRTRLVRFAAQLLCGSGYQKLLKDWADWLLGRGEWTWRAGNDGKDKQLWAVLQPKRMGIQRNCYSAVNKIWQTETWRSTAVCVRRSDLEQVANNSTSDRPGSTNQSQNPNNDWG